MSDEKSKVTDWLVTADSAPCGTIYDGDREVLVDSVTAEEMDLFSKRVRIAANALREFNRASAQEATND